MSAVCDTLAKAQNYAIKVFERDGRVMEDTSGWNNVRDVRKPCE